MVRKRNRHMRTSAKKQVLDLIKNSKGKAICHQKILKALDSKYFPLILSCQRRIKFKIQTL